MRFPRTATGRTGGRDSSGEDRGHDQKTLTRMAQGDADALGELYDRYVRGVYSLAFRILHDGMEAEDVVQEVFAQVWKQASRYDASRGVVLAWLLTLTRSRAIDRLRARRARGAGSSDERALQQITDSSPPADLQVLSSEQVGRLRAALDELPMLQRSAIELSYFEGLTHVEVAAQLEQPLGTVKTRIRLALRKLREVLEGTV
jgi:RNA polymerase sigma-70 factor (ECF subfamily)